MVLGRHWLLLWQATRIFQGLDCHRVIKNDQICAVQRAIKKNIRRYRDKF